MSKENYNAYEHAQAQFNSVADKIGLDEATCELLRQPIREYHFTIPVKMDDGSTKVFKAFRIQHNDARGPAKEVYVSIQMRLLIPLGHCPCG